ncbi:hypothetical protein DFS33DRAFT_1237849, partial [Desarmillaria ectypa]
WDFLMLAMSSAHNGEAKEAIDWLLHPYLIFCDVGISSSNVHVTLPYFLDADGLLYAIAMMAGGWDSSEEDVPDFPKDGWVVHYKSLSKPL